MLAWPQFEQVVLPAAIFLYARQVLHQGVVPEWPKADLFECSFFMFQFAGGGGTPASAVVFPGI